MSANPSRASLALLALSVVACGLSGTGTTPPAAPTATPEVVPAPEGSPTPEPPPPSDFAAVLDAEVAAGEVTLEAGLIRLLRAFLGEATAELPASYGRVVTTEGNSIVERAAEYIAQGPDETAAAEMARLLDILFPSPEQLEAYSRPASARRLAPGLARPPAQIDCASLYLAGFPLEGVTAYPCFEYVSGSVGAAGSYTIYYPAIWYEGHPDRRWLEPANAAAEASMETFGRYSVIGPVNIIFSLSPGRSASFLAQVSAYHRGAREVCPILIFPSALDLSEAEFQQSIAHEMFHCFQLRNYPGQLLGVNQADKQWWSEGTAEYFSNVVYPGVNFEQRWIPTFDSVSPSTALYRMGYETFGFFQQVANSGDDTAVLALIGSMPTSGGSEQQRQHLAGMTGIEDAFHEFGRAYLDGRILDSGGGAIPFFFDRGPVLEVPAGTWNQTVEAEPFVVQRQLLSFAEDTRFSIVAELGDGEGRYGAQPNGQSGVWQTLPGRLNTACEEREFQLLLTTTSLAGSPAALALETLGESLPPDTVCDCLVGTWVVDNATVLPYLGTLLDLGVAGAGIDARATGVTGVMSLTFDPEGTASGSQTGWTVVGEASLGGEVVEARIRYDGGGTASWRSETVPDTEDHFVVFEDGEYGLTATFALIGRGVVIAQNSSSLSDTNATIFLSGSQPYVCSDSTLTYLGGDLPPVTFRRVAGESPAP